MAKTRVVAYIDGYNLYHGIVDMTRDESGKPGPRLSYLKWLDLRSLVEAFIPKSREELVKTYYFSAYATWKPKSLIRHRAYVAALESTGVEVVMGKFKEKSVTCYKCNAKFTTHEEKETDVNLALRLLHDAVDNSFDRAIIITGDSDLKPAALEAKAHNPNLVITVLLPSKRLNKALDLVSVCDGAQKFNIRHMEKSLFPEAITTADGKTIKRPAEYRP